MSWTKGIAPFVVAIGAILLGPVWTMIMPPETFVGSYVYGAIDATLVISATLILYFAFTNIYRRTDEVG